MVQELKSWPRFEINPPCLGEAPAITLPAGQAACIGTGDLAQFGLNVSNSGPLPREPCSFSRSPHYRPPQAQQA